MATLELIAREANERGLPSRRSPAPQTLSVVPWPTLAVEQRDIAAYAQAVGGAR